MFNWIEVNYKRLVVIMLLIITFCSLIEAETHWASSKNGFNWTDKYITSNDDAKALICEYLGLSGAEFEQFKGKYSLDMRGNWDGYNQISRQYKTPNASFIKCVGKDTYVVFAYSNGQLKYGNVFKKVVKK